MKVKGRHKIVMKMNLITSWFRCYLCSQGIFKIHNYFPTSFILWHLRNAYIKTRSSSSPLCSNYLCNPGTWFCGSVSEVPSSTRTCAMDSIVPYRLWVLAMPVCAKYGAGRKRARTLGAILQNETSLYL